MKVLFKRYLLIATGITSLSLGVLGAFIPLLPTVPLVLLAGYCFARSSPRLHNWLLTHTTFGRIIRNFEAGEGVPKKVKIRAILIIWLSMAVSCWFVGRMDLCILLVIVGLAVSVYLYRLPEGSGSATIPGKTDTTPD